jgi:hypothetical protein
MDEVATLREKVSGTDMASSNEVSPPSQFAIGEDLNWDAPWIDVNLWGGELPFWLMVDNTTVNVDVEGHEFSIALHDDYFELHGQGAFDSKQTVCYRGPLRKLDELSDDIQQLRRNSPELPLIWRKCKTVLKIGTRCNEDVWAASMGEKDLRESTTKLYLGELCKAHIPIVNRLVQGYRLATYDYFAFEVAQWDVPHWMIERGGKSTASLLVPYRGWDMKPVILEGETQKLYQLIRGENLCNQISATATSGEYELLDALNLMERGDYSGAVRRITTAIEVVVEDMVGREVEAVEGKPRAEKFLRDTKTNFNRRISKYETLSTRTMSDGLRRALTETRNLRHRIVHRGYRIRSGERGLAQRSVDTGRWIFNWFENDNPRQTVREKNLAFRSLGRDLLHGVFPTKITPDGVVVSWFLKR